MPEVEGEWADVLHESAREAATAQASAKPVSVPEPAVTLSDVAPANAVCYLASEGEHISDNGSFPTANFSVRYGKLLTTC